MSKTLKELRQNQSQNNDWEQKHSRHIKNKLKALKESKNRISTKQKLKGSKLNFLEGEDEESFYYR